MLPLESSGKGYIRLQGEPTEEEWRELAKQAAQEKDSNKLLALVGQLIVKFDESKQGKSQQ